MKKIAVGMILAGLVAAPLTFAQEQKTGDTTKTTKKKSAKKSSKKAPKKDEAAPAPAK